MLIAFADHRAMPRRPRKPPPKLHLGEWIARLGRTQAEVAKGAGIGAPYLANLIAGDKKNPSGWILLAISDVLGITVNDLYREPPPPEAIEAAAGLTPAEIATLGRLLSGMRGQGRK